MSNLLKTFNIISLSFLLIGFFGCIKDSDKNPKNSSDQVFTGKYSNLCDNWKLITIENGFNKTEKALEFDNVKFAQPATYEIEKNGICVEKGTIAKDTAYSTDILLCATFIPDNAFQPIFINPSNRYFILRNDTLNVLSLLDTNYSYLFVRNTNWIQKSVTGFHMNTGSLIILEQNEIDYYDGSSHLIYLKDENSLIKHLSGALIDTYVDSTFIYPLVMYPMTSNSYARSGANIMSWPTLYPSNVVFIDYTDFERKTDNRNDTRILNVLENSNKYHEGLNCDIQSVQVTADNKVKLELTLTNNDSFDYYYMDPTKMGLKLFHYFTEGLILDDNQGNKYLQRIGSTPPESLKTWSMQWLNLIKKGDEIAISILYDQFDTIPAGQYQASFQFPGLTYQVTKDDIQQSAGRIWLGKLNTTKYITIE